MTDFMLVTLVEETIPTNHIDLRKKYFFLIHDSSTRK